jgi:hypothetical protein
MVIDYMNNKMLNEKTANMSVMEIADAIGTRSDGTNINDVSKINKKIVDAVPSLEFKPEYRPHTLEDIHKLLESGLPCIAWLVIKPDGIHETVHAVVITGLDLKANVIYYNDPYFSKESESLGEFTAKWERADRALVRLVLGGKQRKVLTEWMVDNDEGAGSKWKK